MKGFTISCVLGLFMFMAADTETFAAPQENGDRKCTDGRDNDFDGLIDEADPGCSSGTGGSDVARRVRVSFSTTGALLQDGNGNCADSGIGSFQYWHSNPGQGPHDSPCDDITTNGFGEPSQRLGSAMLACGFCFNTYGPSRPHDPTSWHHVNRWVTFDWSASSATPNLPDIDNEIYVAGDPNSPTVNGDSQRDNLEILFDMPDPFADPTPGSVSDFTIRIRAPLVRRNGRVVWQDRYTLVYPTDVTVAADTTAPIDPNLVTISTSSGSGNNAILTNLSTGASWDVRMPFSFDARQVFGDGDGGCCFADAPP